MEQHETIPALPLLVNWNITYRCNYHCSHCYSRSEKYNDSTLQIRREILAMLVEYKVPFVNLGGGEPLLLADLFNLVEEGSQQGVRFTLSTNGSLIDDHMVKRIKNSRMVKVEVSLDGADAHAHERLREQKDSFNQTVHAIELLREADLTVDISTVVNRFNFNELEGVISLARRLGVRKISFHNYKCSGNGYLNREKLDLSPPEWKKFYQWILPLRDEKNDVIISVDDPITAALDLPKKEKTVIQGSSCGKLSLRIKANGEITPCGFIPVGIGNILNDDLKEVWDNSELLLKMRHKLPTGKCVSCRHYTECLGGCTARALAISGKVNFPDPHCWID